MTAAVFVDTSYLVALLDVRDRLHGRALRLTRRLARDRAELVSSDAVLVELGNYCARGPLRARAAGLIAALRSASGWEVLPLDRKSLLAAETKYGARVDKSWSVTDCVAMEIMRARAISEAATYDVGFEQAGFRALLREG